jgi:uncharacterized 2Fe-2S/4Fe-4S cluster protein (DUF4445 family)
LTDLILLLDIGTTTISAEIINAKGFKSLASGVILNSQAEIGEDIISRIDFAIQNKQNALALQKKTAGSVNRLVKRLLRENSIKGENMAKVFCACNSAMHHIFLGIETLPLITPPYKTTQKSEATVYADMIGLDIRKNLEITFLPGIGGFVGSDALCAIFASDIFRSRSLMVVMDIGTNGEIAVGNAERISVASTAAGPAFEARYIKNGMPAVKGAISGVRIKNGRVKLDVIGNTRPEGITGSGLIDACYQIYLDGFIDRSGRMKAEEFVLYRRGRKKIVVTQSDIRKIQLAKGAVLAVMKTLLRRHKADNSDIKQIILTGAFGESLKAESIIGIGLTPKIDKKRIKYIQNAVLKGLKLWAQNKLMRDNVFSLLSKIDHIPLFGKAFGKEFTGSLQF